MTAPSTSTSASAHRLRAAVHMLAVLCTAPLLLAHALRQYLCRRASSESAAMAGDAAHDLARGRRRTVLVTGGKMAKSLNIARALWRAGHRVVLVETDKYWCSGARLSKAVWAFDTVTDPRVDGAAYLADLRRAFEAHGCDAFLPVSSPFSAHYDAMFLRDKPQRKASPAKEGDDKSVASVSSTDDSITDEDSTASTEGLGGGVDRVQKLMGDAKTTCIDSNLHFNSEVCDILDDKDAFSRYCTETLGLPSSDSNNSDGAMLPSHRLCSDDQVLALNQRLRDSGREDKYVLKNLGYDPLHRLDLFCLPADEATVTQYLKKIRDDGNGVSAREPWQAQRFIENGTEISCFAVLRASRPEVYTCALSSASQLRYVHLGGTRTPKRNEAHTLLIDAQAAACRRWVDTFCAALRAKGEHWNGQLCWDFMCTDGDAVAAYPLECNPRVHSQTAVFGPDNGDQRRFGWALVGAEPGPLIVPDMSTDAEAETHFWGWWANEFFSRQGESYLLLCLETLHTVLSYAFLALGLMHERGPRVFRYAKDCDANATWYTSHFSLRDSDFDAEDPLPFLGRNLLQPLVLFWGVLVSGNEWTKYDFCIGKVVEKNGD